MAVLGCGATTKITLYLYSGVADHNILGVLYGYPWADAPMPATICTMRYIVDVVPSLQTKQERRVTHAGCFR